MFTRTIGGNVEQKSLNCASYTFPETAAFKIHGIAIPIGGIRVDCYLGPCDKLSINHFTSVTARVRSSRPEIYNTDIVIFLDDFFPGAYPPRRFFEDCGLKKCPSFSEYNALLRKHSNPNVNMMQLMSVILKWEQVNRQKIGEQLNAIVDSNGIFPKLLSVIVGSKKPPHATHIVLEFSSASECSVRIDLSFSLLLKFALPSFLETLRKQGINPDTCKEIMSQKDPNVIQVSPYHSLKFQGPVNKLLVNEYKKVRNVLEQIDILVTKMSIHHSSYIPKDEGASLPMAMQNKIDFVTDSEYVSEVTEEYRNMAMRLRAEQLISSFFMQGIIDPPRYVDNFETGTDRTIDKDDWYPNANEVKEQLLVFLSLLSFKKLRHLYIAQIKSSENTGLHASIMESILLAMSKKGCNNELQKKAPLKLDSIFSNIRRYEAATNVLPALYNRLPRRTFFVCFDNDDKPKPDLALHL